MLQSLFHQNQELIMHWEEKEDTLIVKSCNKMDLLVDAIGVIELALWCDNNVREFHSTIYDGEWLAKSRNNKEELIKLMKDNYKNNIWLQ